jgi:hypothetical protein
MPEPHLQPHPLADRATYEARQRATLTQYAWVDRGAGIVRIPIGRAMQILAERGGPADTTTGSKPTPTPAHKERRPP